MIKTRPSLIVPAIVVLCGLVCATGPARADGTETLGPPQGLTLATGTGIVAAGVGLSKDAESNTISFKVPDGATVKQVLIYWEGQTPEGGAVDVEFTLNGTTVTATDPGDATDGDDRIGAPINFYNLEGVGDIYAIAYRYDITSLGLVVPGDNTLTVEGLDGFGFTTDGAGVLVIFEEPNTPASNIQLVDGIDLAFIGFDEPKKSTVPQEFTFPAADQPRMATLTMFFSSVKGETSGEGPLRPSSIEVTVGGATTTYSNLLNSNDGPEWDTHTFMVTIPSGATSLTVQAFSRNDQDPGSLEPLPASFFWLAAGLSVSPAPPRMGEGCTPGYWKQWQHFGNWPEPYTPKTLFSEVFEDAFPGKTLLDVLWLGGGGLSALGRHTVAALLNAASEKVSYDLTASEVIDMFNDVYPGSKNDYQEVHSAFADFNERVCPLSRAEPPDGDRWKPQEHLPTIGLLQNYPNPFNPETQISFVLPEGGYATLRIYNTLGQEVRTLVDGILAGGVHTVRWDGNGDRGNSLPSGIYIYRMQAGDYVEIRKMTLMR